MTNLTNSDTVYQGRIQVLWDLKFTQFLGPSLRKEYKITNTKLGTKVNICFEKEKMLKQISDLKKK